jgi:hypothetical protein
MPFEPAPKDVSLADKLAALIEAGRATHPNAAHIRDWGDGKHTGCAMTFAAMGAGLVGLRGRELLNELATAMGTTFEVLEPLAQKVIEMNDGHRAPLAEIVTAIREDKWPTHPTLRVSAFDPLLTVSQATYKAFQQVYAEELAKMQNIMLKHYYTVQPFEGKVLYSVGFDEAAEWKTLKTFTVDEIKPPKVAKVAQPAKHVRVNAKTGASWPKPKHAYA